MSIELFETYLRKAVYDKMDALLGMQSDDEIRSYVDDLVDDNIKMIEKGVRNGDYLIPKPGKIARNIMMEFCKQILLDYYGTQENFTRYIMANILSSTVYRNMYKKNEAYTDIIDYLNDDFREAFRLAIKKNPKCKLFTFSEKLSLGCMCLTPFIVVALGIIFYKKKKEKKAIENLSDKQYLFHIRMFKYSELLTYSLYDKEYSVYDKNYQEELEKEQLKEELERIKEEKIKEEFF